MSSFDFYIHGTPRGHQIWGSERNHDYISTFYNHDSQAKEKAILQADIYGGDSFYTYLQHQNLFDVEGRPKAFFAITVSFHNAYCTNVYKLYQLFDAVYNQLCIDSFIKRTGTSENFIVADFTVARSGANATVDKIQAAFNQKIDELISPYLAQLNTGDTFNKPQKAISLLEIDSPLFFDYFKKFSIIISPTLQPTAVAYDSLANELKDIIAQKNALQNNNNYLQAEILKFTQENKNLTLQLHSSTTSTEAKYKNKIELLKQDLNKVTEERNSLKTKFDDIISSFEAIDKPLRNLGRLLAGRLPESNTTKNKSSIEAQQKISKTNLDTEWRNWLNSLLLGIITILSIIMLYFTIANNSSNNNSIKQIKDKTKSEVFTMPKTVDSIKIAVTNNKSGIEENQIQYQDPQKCTINIKGGGATVTKNKKYVLEVCESGTFAKVNVPKGFWRIDFGKGKQQVLNDNSFTLSDSMRSNTNILVQYIVDDKVYVSRPTTIK